MEANRHILAPPTGPQCQEDKRYNTILLPVKCVRSLKRDAFFELLDIGFRSVRYGATLYTTHELSEEKSIIVKEEEVLRV